mgnify:CR=1 FL=1
MYDSCKDTAVPNDTSIIPRFVGSLKLYNIETQFTEVCMKDSRDLQSDDIKKILSEVEASSHTKVLITHGTYTLGDTARYLKVNLKRDDQIVVLTASAIPIMGFSPSDGPFSLGYAIAKLEHLSPGVYVAVNGHVFSPEEIMKVMSEARFTSIFQR